MTQFSNLEFHRSGIGVLTALNDADPGAAIYLENAAGSTRPLRFCSCTAGRRRTCKHLAELGRQIKLFRKKYRGRSFGEIFSASPWHELAHRLFEGDPQAFVTSTVTRIEREDGPRLRFYNTAGEALVDYHEISPGALRLLERLGKVSPEIGFQDRAELIDKLSIFLRSSEEQHLNRAGMKTNRQSFEESLWYRFAYHCFREFEDEEGAYELSVHRSRGILGLTYHRQSGKPSATFYVPRSRVPSVLEFAAEGGLEPPLDIAIGSLESILSNSASLESGSGWAESVQAVLDYEETGIAPERIEPFIYGNLAFIPELSVFTEFEDPDGAAALHRARKRTPTPVPQWGQREPFDDPVPKVVLDDPTRELRILREFDHLEIAAQDENELDVHYAFGDARVAIRDIADAKRRGLAYLETDLGWVDLSAPELRGVEGFIGAREADAPPNESLKLSSAQILRLKSSTSKPVRIEASQDRTDILHRLLDYRPSQPLVPLKGLTSQLRPYQTLGVEWLHFLYENHLAGLLCDDMGLGKTHQAMALMVLIREQHGVEDPNLVICPRTVISHWRDKIAQYAPGLRAAVYHGSQRDLDQTLEEADVVIASYGVLRNDVAKLSEVPWSLVVFDEVQQIKNQETQAHRAAITVPARMKVGLTGTPIENSLSELKNLFDLVLPRYLGEDEDYFDRYGASSRDEPDDSTLEDLRRLIAPFVLRRLKTAVLHELPEKIEDIRTCSLSDEQRQLYRSTIDTRGMALAETIRKGKDPLPYIHIFALLNQLKQICDHPALAIGKAEEWRDHRSSKWDLFVDLLEESLQSGQKVVVFSQYLGMISIMEDYLRERRVPLVKLTGSTRKRGEVVNRFNQDPDCRVFLGSLRAGGTGIDLVAGSVVIHYDRWWNAAKEDQATDRVYRIGQKRAVQVFKLVTEDTLEEKIAAMIDRKRKLMSSVVQADHPKLGKIFSRDELLELLRQVD